jgi:hypothetical protein
MHKLDPSQLLPRVVHRTYFDACGVADVAREPGRFGFVRPLGNDLFTFLACVSDELIRNVHQEHLDALHLSVDVAHALAIENLRKIAFDGTTIQQRVTKTGTGNDWSVWIGNTFTSSCLLLPELFSWSKKYLNAEGFLVRVPSTQLLFIIQSSTTRDNLAAFDAYIADVVEDCDDRVSSDWFRLDQNGVIPFAPG